MEISVEAPSQVDVWDFGGYPYGLMPLVLPDLGCRSDDGDHGQVDHQLELMNTATQSPEDRAESVEQLFWFRWITGNQAVAALWQILDDELELVLHGELESAADNASALLDGYSAVLVYAGTPTVKLYHHLIRPAMALQHRSFTGRWAQDYLPVMAKLQALRATYRTRARPVYVDSLIAASKRNHKAHVAVAAKLVPGEESLLRANDGLSSLGAPTHETTRLYDAFYSTVRVLVSREKIVEQLIVRIRAIVRDIRSNGMYPAESCSRQERPANLWDAELTELENNITEVLNGAARAAAAALRPTAGR